MGTVATMDATTPQDMCADARFATGVAVVTTAGPDRRPRGSTANAISSVSLSPPLVLVCLREQSETLASLRATGGFAINVLAEDQQPLADRFARASCDAQWEGVSHSTGATGSPLFDGTLAALECAVHEEADGGDHRIVIGRVLSIRLADEPATPLLFSERATTASARRSRPPSRAPTCRCRPATATSRSASGAGPTMGRWRWSRSSAKRATRSTCTRAAWSATCSTPAAAAAAHCTARSRSSRRTAAAWSSTTGQGPGRRVRGCGRRSRAGARPRRHSDGARSRRRAVAARDPAAHERP